MRSDHAGRSELMGVVTSQVEGDGYHATQIEGGCDEDVASIEALGSSSRELFKHHLPQCNDQTKRRVPGEGPIDDEPEGEDAEERGEYEGALL